MLVVTAFILLGLSLGLRLQSRLGAFFLAFAAAVVLQVVIEAVPRLLGHSESGRWLSLTLRFLGRWGGDSLLDTTLGAAAGVVSAMLLQTMSQDRRIADWNPDKAIHRRLKRHGRIRHDPC
jgi:hypothetical protein